MTPARRPSARLAVAIPLLATAIALAAAEVTLRIVGTPTPDSSKLLTEYDPVLGWRKKPLATKTYRTREYTATVSTNSKGLRGPEHSFNAPPDTYRILMLGDSFAEGYTTSFDSTAGAVMERLLDASGTGKYEVINGGTAGYSTDQELLYFREHGRNYKPDVTLLTFYINDVMYNSRPRYWRGSKPYFRLSRDSLELHNVPVPKPGDADAGGDPLASDRSWLSRHSRLLGLARNVIDRSRGLSALLVRVGVNDIPDDWRPWKVAPDSTLEGAWGITEALLARLNQEVIRNGGYLVVFYVPSRAAVYPGDWSSMMATYGLADSEWNPTQDAARLGRICRRSSIDCVDHLDRFRKEASERERSGERLYFTHDVHWNAEGHRLAGSLMAEHILKLRAR